MKKTDEKRKGRFIRQVLPITLLYVFVFFSHEIFDAIETLKARVEENRVNNLPIIDIEYKSTPYDQGNWQNWNIATEDESYIFYTGNGVDVERKNKFTQGIKIIVNKQSGVNPSHFMVFDDYLIFRRGKEIIRMKKNGSESDVIYKGDYPIDLKAYKDRLYFFIYHKGIYTVDVNGRDLKCINPQPIKDMTIYDERIYYSFIADGEGYVKSMDLEGLNKKDILKAEADNIIVRQDGIYYVDNQTNQLFKYDGKIKQLICQNKIDKFGISEDGIYGIEIHNGRDVGFKEEYFNLYFIKFAEGKFQDPVIIDRGREANGFSILNEYIYYEAGKERKPAQLITRRRQE